MLKTEWDEYGVSIQYDGVEFYLIPSFTDEGDVAVTYQRPHWQGGAWAYYKGKPFKTISEACAAIFWECVAVRRTELGHLSFDKFGAIVNLTPLTYYELPAEPRPF